MTEAVLLVKKHVLLVLCNDDAIASSELDHVTSNFCGLVFCDADAFACHAPEAGSVLYLVGSIDACARCLRQSNVQYAVVYIVDDLSTNTTATTAPDYTRIRSTQVPRNIGNVGVFVRDFFDRDTDYFASLSAEHTFQSLSLSDKPGTAYRTGLYITSVTEDARGGRRFKLLRCSTNLDGPTDNVRATDERIIAAVNGLRIFFDGAADLNHVLAQVYHNVTDEQQRERKARIALHSDKTKDMPSNGLIAFCTFYQGCPDDVDERALTRLRFRLKGSVPNKTALLNDFDVVLYPNSVFVISLTTNRLYTHAIVPSTLPIARIPTRMGYVVRCSNTNAVFRDQQTYIDDGATQTALHEPTAADLDAIKALYWQENATADRVTYGDVYFSLNSGDYRQPLL